MKGLARQINGVISFDIDRGTRISLIFSTDPLFESHTVIASSVQEYAYAQHLHPNYFSKVIKSKSGKAIGTWIAEKTIMEAKSLLRNRPCPSRKSPRCLALRSQLLNFSMTYSMML
jgi:hypothetical protein